MHAFGRVVAGTLAATVVCCMTCAVALCAEWAVTAQPNLADEIAQAPELAVQDLGTAVYGIDDPNDSGMNFVPCADKSYDMLLWYRKDYQHGTRVYIVNSATGKVSLQTFETEENRVRVEQGFTWWGVIGFDGMLYGADPVWPEFSNGGLLNIYRYDPAEKRISLYKQIKGHGGETTALALSPTGWIYGSGTWCGEGDTHHKASAYGFNPATGEVKDFGAVGPKIDGTGYGASIGCDDQYVYVACGKIPWALVSIDVKTGEQKTVLTAPVGGDFMYINSNPRRFFGGAMCFTQQGVDAPKKFYWLYHGQAIPKKGTEESNGWEMDDTCPWPKETQTKSPTLSAPPRPEVHTGQLNPDADDKAVMYWRAAAPQGQTSTAEWRQATLEGVKKFPLRIHRFQALPDGLLFGTGDGYKGRFVFDPKTEKVTYLGRGGGSLYCLATLGDKLYWSGYDCGRIFEFDPSKPWNLEAGGPPGQKRIASTDPEAIEAGVNPRRLHKDIDIVFHLTRVKKMLSATVAADGRIYFGGIGQRDYEGGGLSWYDPKTGDIGGMWKPFDGRGIGCVTTALGGRYVVIGSRVQGVGIAKVFVYDTTTHEIVRDIAIADTGSDDQKVGPLLEVAPGRMIGFMDSPENRQAGILYGLDVTTGEVLFRKPLPNRPQADWSQGITPWDYRMGPDGFIWTFLDTCLVRIDPRDASVRVVGRVKPVGQMAFIGRDLYLTGTEQLRRLRNIVPENN